MISSRDKSHKSVGFLTLKRGETKMPKRDGEGPYGGGGRKSGRGKGNC